MINVIADNRRLKRVGAMKEQTDRTGQPKNQHESTYALLIRSEEKSRNVIEMAIYPILILGAVIAIWQFAQQPVSIPSTGLKGAGCLVCVDEIKTLREARRPEIKG
jgi:hypothetical protein